MDQIFRKFVERPHYITSHNRQPLEIELHRLSLVSKQWSATVTPLLYADLAAHYGAQEGSITYTFERTKRQSARVNARLGALARGLVLECRQLEESETARICAEVLRDLHAFPRLTTRYLAIDPNWPPSLEDTLAGAIFSAMADALRNLRTLSWTYPGKELLSRLLRLANLRSLTLSGEFPPNWDRSEVIFPPLPFRLTSFTISPELSLPAPHLILIL